MADWRESLRDDDLGDGCVGLLSFEQEGDLMPYTVVDASGSFVVAAAGGRGWTSEGAMGSADGCMVYEVCPVW